MKILTLCFLLTLNLGTVCASEIPLQVIVSFDKGAKYKFKITYHTKEVKDATTHVKGMILLSQSVSFYDSITHRGTYYVFRDIGTPLPDSISYINFNIVPNSSFDRVEIEEKFFDISWRYGSKTEDELADWFKLSWNKFNTLQKNSNDYRIVSDKAFPDIEKHLQNSGFRVFRVFHHKSTIPWN